MARIHWVMSAYSIFNVEREEPEEEGDLSVRIQCGELTLSMNDEAAIDLSKKLAAVTLG